MLRIVVGIAIIMPLVAGTAAALESKTVASLGTVEENQVTVTWVAHGHHSSADIVEGSLFFLGGAGGGDWCWGVTYCQTEAEAKVPRGRCVWVVATTSSLLHSSSATASGCR